jgi:hypothetical protein
MTADSSLRGRAKHRRIRTRFGVAAVLLGALAGAEAGEVSTVDGIPHVTNSAVPAEGVRTLELEEVWRRGGWDDEEMIFGIINRVLVDDQQNIFLLDAQLSEVKVISPDGELQHVLGREGDGPGEFRGPTDMCFLPDGTLGIAQAFPGKVVKIGLDNSPAGTWTIGDPSQGAFYIVRALRQGGGNIVLGGTEQHIDQAQGIVTRETFLSSLDADGMRATTFVAKDVTIKFQEIVFDERDLIDGPDRRYDVAPDGRVVAAPDRNRYEVRIFGPDGNVERVFSREYESWKRDEAAKGIWDRILTSIRDQQAPQAPVQVEETEPDVEFLHVAGDGRIWILNSRSMWSPPEGIFTEYDVFSADGHFVEQVRLVCDGDPRRDMPFFAGEDLVFVVTGFWDTALSQFGGAGGGEEDEEAEPMSVICYRIL